MYFYTMPEDTICTFIIQLSKPLSSIICQQITKYIWYCTIILVKLNAHKNILQISFLSQPCNHPINHRIYASIWALLSAEIFACIQRCKLIEVATLTLLLTMPAKFHNFGFSGSWDETVDKGSSKYTYDNIDNVLPTNTKSQKCITKHFQVDEKHSSLSPETMFEQRMYNKGFGENLSA